MAPRTGERDFDQTDGLAKAVAACQGRQMDNKKTPMAGGFGIAIGAVGGSLLGAHYGQMSLGLVLGLAAGTLLAALVWYLDTRR